MAEDANGSRVRIEPWGEGDLELLPEREKVGSVGYWERVWNGEPVYEMGWAVLTPYQGRGIATAALLATVAEARARQTHRYAHAFPSVDNLASNGVCRRAGFELMGETDFEFPPGRFMRSNDWRLDVTLGGTPAGSE
ncbi:MAG TPA: GNAT family N-acetyltransferase [Micromonospora sp.]|nr:GNAT family N-acetyltransferase [Micromonospora sp.]